MNETSTFASKESADVYVDTVETFSTLSLVERNAVLDRIRSEIKGRMMDKGMEKGKEVRIGWIVVTGGGGGGCSGPGLRV